MAKPPSRYVYYFCDESSYVDDEFMAIGGLAIPDRHLSQVTTDLIALKQQMHGPSEVKWSTAKSRNDDVHAAFVDYFADALAAGRIHFHIRFAPFQQYDHKVSGPRKRIDTVSKMHFQLLLHRAVRFYGRHYKLRIRPDNGDCTAALVDQLASLHSWGAHHYNCPTDCIESIEPRDSRREPLLQLLDVPLGAFTALRNNRQLVGPKRALADYVRAKFLNKNLSRNTAQNVMDFSIWNVIPSGPPARGPWS